MKNNNNDVVNILVECPDLIASVRVGVLEPLYYVEKAGKCNVHFKKTIEITKADIEWCDILITVRGFEFVTLEIVKAARKAGRYVIYFLDDDLLNLPKDIPSGKCFDNSDTRSNMLEILQLSNKLWCVNELIGLKYGKYCNENWILGKVPVEIKELSSEDKHDITRILYAGSSDHSKTIQKYISPAVQKLCDEYGDKINFTFIGANPNIKGLKNVCYVKFLDNYDEYKQLVENGRFDIGMAIVLEDEFYKFKYYNKFIEYTSIGAVGIYTNSEPYRLIVEDKHNGFLCKNGEWYDVLKKVIDNSELRRQCVANANTLLKQSYSYQAVSDNIIELVPEIINYKADKNCSVHLLNPRWLYYKYKINSLWKEYKLLIVFIIMIKLINKIIKKIGNVYNGVLRRKQ